MKKEKEAMIEILSKRSDVLFAYLFGSNAKGYANEHSDWDIAVYFKKCLKQNGRWPEFELEADLSKAVRAQAQVVVLNRPLSPVFGFEIIKHGFVLIDRNQNFRMDFENRVLRQYYDWQYFLNRQIEAERHRMEISDREAWFFENKVALKKVKKSLSQKGRIKRGSFGRYAK